MTPRKTSISFAAVLAVLGTAAVAQDAGQASFCEQGYARADANADGVVGPDELSAVTDAEFSELDADGDGSVSAAEYAECRAGWMQDLPDTGSERTEERMAELDTNADGRLDRNEFMGTVDQDQYFARWGRMPFTESVRDERGATANQGQSAEARTDAATTGERTGEDDAAGTIREMRHVIRGPQGASLNEMSQDDMAARTAQMFLILDANNDSVVDRPEWVRIRLGGEHLTDSLAAAFGRADADGSGDLSPEEYAADRERQWNRGREQAAEAGNQSDVGAPVVYFRYPHPM